MSVDLLHQAVALLMHDELSDNRLLVGLADCWGHMGDDGRRRRVVEWQNPEWYRDFCAAWGSGRSRPRRKRHGDTLIKRQHVLRALAEIGHGRVGTVYAQRLWPVVCQRVAQIQQEHRARHAAWWMWLEQEEVMAIDRTW